MKFSAKIIRPGLWGLTAADLRDVGRQAIARTGFFWHVNFKPLHYQMSAFGKYGYRLRSRKWEARKAHQHPEAEGRPLVFTGESERAVLGANRVEATAKDNSHYHADVILANSKMNFHAFEATKVTADEKDVLEAVFAREFEAGVEEVARLRGATSGQIELWNSALEAA